MCAMTSCITGPDDEPKETSLLFVGDSAPAFEITASDDTKFTSPTGFNGKTTLLVFFQTTCGDCQREIPKALDLWHELADEDDVQVLFINRAQTAADVYKYWNEYKKTNGYESMPVFYLDPSREVFSLFATSYIPRVYIIDSTGTIKWMAVEYLLTDSGKEMTKEELLALFNSYRQ